MNDELEIGRRIKQSREKADLTQEELGNALGLNKSTIQRYESGKVARIKLPVLEAIAIELGVNPEYLALQTDDPIDYENSEEVLNAPLDVRNHYNNDAKKIYEFKKAVEGDAVSENVIYEPAEDIKIVARHLEEIPVDKREELVDLISRTISAYKNAIERDKKGG